MSQLSLYCPRAEDDLDAEPVIYSFADYAQPATINFQEALLTRARQLHQNRACPCCNSARVVTVDEYRPRQPSGYRLMTAQPVRELACEACQHHWRPR